MASHNSPTFLLILVLIFLGLSFLLLAGFSAPLILGVLLSTLSYPLFERMTKTLRGQKSLAALLVLLLIVLAIIAPFVGIATLMTNEGLSLFQETKIQLSLDQPLIQNAERFLSRFNIDLRLLIQEQLGPGLKNLGLFIYQRIGGLLSNVFGLLFGFVIMLVTIFYLLKDGKAFGSFLLRATPMQERDKLKIYHTFKETGRAVFLGMFLSAIAQGILGALGFLIFGIPHPTFWGVMIAFISIFPFIGAYPIYIPAFIYLLLKGSTVPSIIFLLYNIFIVSTIDNVIKPKFISRKTEIHPLFIFLAILGGLKVFGLSGIIYGPLIAAVALVLLTTYLEFNEEFNKQ